MKTIRRAATTAALAAIAFVFTTSAALAQARPSRSEGSETAREAKVRLPEPPTKTVKIAVGSEATISEYDITVKLLSVKAGRSATLEVLYSGGKNYVGYRHAAGDSPRLGSSHYGEGPNLLAAATVLYRTHRTCYGKLDKTKLGNGYEIVDLRGYTNYECQSRFHEQCIMDRSFDTFYDERYDFAPVLFALGTAKGAGGFEVKLTKAEAGSATVEVKSTLPDRWGPALAQDGSNSSGAKNPPSADRATNRPAGGVDAAVASLPPEAGPAGVATVQGVDADKNGVRDDVQRYIFLTYSDPPTRAALTAIAIQFQNLMRPSLSEDEAVGYGEKLVKAITHLHSISPSRASHMVDELEGVCVNTPARLSNYVRSSELLSGHTF